MTAQWVCLAPPDAEVLVINDAAVDVPTILPSDALHKFAAWKQACALLNEAGMQAPAPPPEFARYVAGISVAADPPRATGQPDHSPRVDDLDDEYPLELEAAVGAEEDWNGAYSPDVEPNPTHQARARALAQAAARGELVEPVLASPGVVLPGPGPVAGTRPTRLAVHRTPLADARARPCPCGAMFPNKAKLDAHQRSCRIGRPAGILRDDRGNNVLPDDAP